MARTPSFGVPHVVLGALALAPAALAGQAEDPTDRILRAVFIEEGAIQLDGHITEPAWLEAPVATGFTQREPEDGAPASERTEVRVAYSASALYVAVRAFDSQPDQIRARLGRRNVISDSDQISIFLDSYDDRRTSFEFAVTPRGSIRDVYRARDQLGGGDDSWDPVWEVATSVDGLGWSAEFRIPFSQLRFDAGGTTWGFQVYRRIERKAEGAWWAPFSQATSGFASQFGRLEGLAGLPSPMRLELRPYAVTDARSQPDGPAGVYSPGREAGVDAGLDLKLGITSDFTLDLTVNPDFGQVEADPAVVNLSAFETFFPERRPFFVEGGGLFQQSSPAGSLFYSRRIGRPPQGAAQSPDGGTVQRPDATRILSAGKVTGKTGGGLGIGVMSALTAREHAVLRDAGGAVTGRHPVEPRTHYLVGRVEQDFREGSHTVGTVVTAVNRSLGDDFGFLRSAAYVASADGVHRWQRNTYRFQWQVAGSRIRGSSEAIAQAQTHPLRYFQRPDAAHLTLDPDRTSLSGFLFRLNAAKEAGTWRYYADYSRVSPGFDLNDTGFQWGADYQSLSVGTQYVRTQPAWVLRTFRLGPDASRSWTTGGERTMTWFRPLFVNGTFRNNWTFAFNPIALFSDELSVHALRGGPGLRENTWHNSFINLSSDGRKRVRCKRMDRPHEGAERSIS
jgi:hypothetical protein